MHGFGSTLQRLHQGAELVVSTNNCHISKNRVGNQTYNLGPRQCPKYGGGKPGMSSLVVYMCVCTVHAYVMSCVHSASLPSLPSLSSFSLLSLSRARSLVHTLLLSYIDRGLCVPLCHFLLYSATAADRRAAELPATGRASSNSDNVQPSARPSAPNAQAPRDNTYDNTTTVSQSILSPLHRLFLIVRVLSLSQSPSSLQPRLLFTLRRI